MPLDLLTYVPTTPGREIWPGGAFHRLRVADTEGRYSHLAANHLAAAINRTTLIHFGDVPYSNAELTETKQNSSTITCAGAGIRFQTQATPTDGDKVEVVSARTFVPASATVVNSQTVAPFLAVAFARLEVSSAANMGASLGFVSAGATGVIAANPTDGIFFVKAKNAASLTARTVQNGGTAHNLTTFNLDNSPSPATGAVSLADATFIELGIKFFIGTSASTSWGEWWVNGAVTPMSSAQVTDIFNMVAVANPLSAHIGFAVNGTTQRSGTVDWARAEVDK